MSISLVKFDGTVVFRMKFSTRLHKHSLIKYSLLPPFLRSKVSTVFFNHNDSPLPPVVAVFFWVKPKKSQLFRPLDKTHNFAH